MINQNWENQEKSFFVKTNQHILISFALVIYYSENMGREKYFYNGNDWSGAFVEKMEKILPNFANFQRKRLKKMKQD